MGIEVFFIDEYGLFCRSDKETAVVESSARRADERPCDSDVITVGTSLQSADRLAVGRFCQVGAISTETGGEHLRQKSHIGSMSQCGKTLLGQTQIGLLIRPSNRILQESNSHYYFFFPSAGLPIASRIVVSACMFCIR